MPRGRSREDMAAMRAQKALRRAQADGPAPDLPSDPKSSGAASARSFPGVPKDWPGDGTDLPLLWAAEQSPEHQRWLREREQWQPSRTLAMPLPDAQPEPEDEPLEKTDFSQMTPVGGAGQGGKENSAPILEAAPVLERDPS